MPSLCIDASKYTSGLGVRSVDRWCGLGVRLVIVQAHPEGYGRETSLELIRTLVAHRCALHADGMPWDSYIYEYMADPDWTASALGTLDLAVGEGHVPRELWLDVEDVDSERGWPSAWRQQAVERDLDACDAWAEAHGLPPTGIYSGKWYWDQYMGSASFPGRELWDSNYDGQADAAVNFHPYGGWTEAAIKQYAGTSTLGGVGGVDLDVLSVDEEAEMSQPVEQTQDDWYGWPSPEAAAVNLKAIADELGQQVAALKTQVQEAQQAALAADQQRTQVLGERDAAQARARMLDGQLDACQRQRDELSAELTRYQRASKDDWKNPRG